MPYAQRDKTSSVGAESCEYNSHDFDDDDMFLAEAMVIYQQVGQQETAFCASCLD